MKQLEPLTRRAGTVLGVGLPRCLKFESGMGNSLFFFFKPSRKDKHIPVFQAEDPDSALGIIDASL